MKPVQERRQHDAGRPWQARVITLLPDAFPGPLAHSVPGAALDRGIWELQTIDLRQFGVGRHRNVDEPPYGGGAGMVLRADVAAAALLHAQDDRSVDLPDWPLLFMSPRGKPLDQGLVRELAGMAGVTILCGRFEGVDERFLQKFPITEISMGDFVLSGGEIAAQALIDATVRLIPHVLGNQASAEDESFSTGLLEYPHFTRPRTWEGMTVPEILLSGHHERIAAWRQAESRELTRKRRPELWRAYCSASGEESSDMRNGQERGEAPKGRV